VSTLPVLVGRSVRLRPIGPGDAAARLALGQHAEIVRMFGGDTKGLAPPTEAAARAWCERLAAHPHAWGIEEEGRLIGEARLDRVNVRVIADNTRAIRAYEKCGFVVEGREREAAMVDGERHDDVLMGLLARDYEAMRKSSRTS
jgi:hypothetical protein